MGRGRAVLTSFGSSSSRPESGSTTSKSKRRVKRRPATARTIQGQHPTLQEEELEAMEEVIALAERLGYPLPEIAVSVDGGAPASQSTKSSTVPSAEEEARVDLGKGLEPCSTLAKKADELRAAVKTSNHALIAKQNTLGIKLGAFLHEKKTKPKEVVTDWDKKLKGSVNKIDFRAGVRSFGFGTHNSEVDALFDTFDAQGTGSLKAGQLRDALATMKDEARKLNKLKAKAQAENSSIDEKIAQIEDVIQATKVVHDALSRGDDLAVDQARPRALELQAVLLAEEREKQTLEEEAASLAEQLRQERLERKAAEQAAAEARAAILAEETRLRAEEEATQLEKSLTLEEAAVLMKTEISSLERIVEKTFAQRLGNTLVQKQSKPKDLVAAWDQKHKGSVNKVEFRQGVRKGLGLKAENKDIDDLFDEYDDDGGGTLDAAELKEALGSMQEGAAEAIEEDARKVQKQERLKVRLARLKDTITSTRQAEDAFIAHSKLSDHSLQEAKDDYAAALGLKRVAVRKQLTLAECTAQDGNSEAELEEAIKNEKLDKIAAAEAARASAEQRALKKLEAEKVAKQQREKRVADKRRNSVLGGTDDDDDDQEDPEERPCTHEEHTEGAAGAARGAGR